MISLRICLKLVALRNQIVMIDILKKYLASPQYLDYQNYKIYYKPIYKALDDFLVSTYNDLNNKNLEQYEVKKSAQGKTAHLTAGKIGSIEPQKGIKDEWII